MFSSHRSKQIQVHISKTENIKAQFKQNKTDAKISAANMILLRIFDQVQL